MNYTRPFSAFESVLSFDSLFKREVLFSFLPFGLLCNWMSVFLPVDATLLAAPLLCQSRATSRGGGPLHVATTRG